MSLIKNTICPFEKQEVTCKICEGTDGAMESIFCEENDHRLLNKIFKSTNVKVKPICGILSPICEFCRNRIDQFDEEFKPHCKEYVVEKVISTAPSDDPFNCLDLCKVELDVENNIKIEMHEIKDIPIVQEVQLPSILNDKIDSKSIVPKCSDVTEQVSDTESNMVGDGLLSEDNLESDSEFLNPDQDETPSAVKKRGRPRKDSSLKEIKKPTECEICGKLVVYIRDHMRSHIKEKQFQCPHCDRSFSQSNNLIYHIRKHTGEKPFACDKCDKTFICKSHLLSHSRFHENDQPYQCEICSKRFNQACNLTKHLRVHSGEKPYSCKICGKAFMNLSNMKVHEKRHQGDCNFTCEICSKTFYDNYHLVRHMKVHSKTKKRFKCVRCPKQFKTMDDLKSHATHHKDPREEISCEICSKPFKSVHRLSLHMRSHLLADNDSLKCDVCLKQYKRRDHMELHRIREHGDPKSKSNIPREVIIDPDTANKQLKGPLKKPYQCDVCFKIFSQSHNLKVHLKTHMPDANCVRLLSRANPMEEPCSTEECSPITIASDSVEHKNEDETIDLSPAASPDTHQMVLGFEFHSV